MNNRKVNKSELDGMLQKAIKQVEDTDIELAYPIYPKVRTYKATSYFGQLRYKSEWEKCEITISEYHLDNGHEAVMNTMVHEVLHACKGGFNHGEQWQEYASIMNYVYDYNISRLGTSKSGYRLPKKEYKVNYIIECQGCDARWTRTRRSKLVTNYDSYRCGECDSKLTRVK